MADDQNDLKQRAKSWFTILKQAAEGWIADGVPRVAAAISFYAMFSLAPLLLLTVALAGFFLGDQAARGQITHQLQDMVGPEAGLAIEAMIRNARHPGAGLFATIIGISTLLFGASGVFAELKAAMNIIWNVEPKKSPGVWEFVRTWLVSFGMVLAVGMLLLASLVVSSVLAGLTRFATGWLPLNGWIISLVDFAVSAGVYVVLFALIYKVLPDKEIGWRYVWGGAALTALLFAIGKLGIGLYLGRASVGSPYGAAGSLVVLLVWIYYSALIVFYGAEVTQILVDGPKGRNKDADAGDLTPHGFRVNRGGNRQET